jgi:hypothetical protein
MLFRSIDDRFYGCGCDRAKRQRRARRREGAATAAASPFTKRVRVSEVSAMAGRTLKVVGCANLTVHWLT